MGFGALEQGNSGMLSASLTENRKQESTELTSSTWYKCGVYQNLETRAIGRVVVRIRTRDQGWEFGTKTKGPRVAVCSRVIIQGGRLESGKVGQAR